MFNMQLFHKTVANMITPFGGIGILRVFGEPVYNDGEAVSAPTDYQVDLALLEFSQANAGDKSKFGTLILSGDKYCLMRPVNQTDPDATPPVIKANRDTITIDNVEWKIFALKTVNPSGINGNDFLFEFHLRK